MRCCVVSVVLATSLLLSLRASAQCTPDDLVTKSKPAIIQEVSISGTRTLSTAELRTIGGKLVGRCVDKDKYLASYVQDEIRDAFQREGFLKVALRGPVEITSIDMLSKPIPLHVAISVDEGDRYRFGNVEFKRNKAFSSDELRLLLPLKRGEIFDIEKVRQALRAFRDLYGERGYINFTPVPDTEFDDLDHLITLVIDLDEGEQFKIASVDFNAAGAVVGRLRDAWSMKIGDAYSSRYIKQFFADNKELMPADADPALNTEVGQDNKKKTVVIRLRLCSSDQDCVQERL
jgi:outer membrane protein assembly factor BamA